MVEEASLVFQEFDPDGQVGLLGQVWSGMNGHPLGEAAIEPEKEKE